jgi:4-amino-4-deoxy-L-arabinose transferase-like glycosyltransferase
MRRASSFTLQWRALIARELELRPLPWAPAATALAIALAALGALTRVRLYLTNRSLWLDEVFIALNLSKRSFAELAKPLDFNQGAPIGFLWIEKAVVTLFGNSEYALRLWPLVLGLASVVLFLILVRRTLGPVAGCVAMLLFVTSPPLNYFSSDAKQYGGDVVYVTLVLLLAQYWRETHRRGVLVALAVLGVLAPWLSHAALFALGAAGLVLAYESIEARRWRETAVLALIGASWALSVAAAYKLTLGALTADSQLQGYWNESFAPLPWSPGALERWRVLVLGWFGGNPMPAYGLPGLTLAIAVLGLARLAVRDRRFSRWSPGRSRSRSRPRCCTSTRCARVSCSSRPRC